MSAFPFDSALAWKILPALLVGLQTTLLLTAIVMVLGLVFSVPLALARMSQSRIVSWTAGVFVVFFRGAPLLIVLYLVYYGLGQIEILRDGPFWFLFASAFSCAVIGLTLNHTAFLVEVVRGGLMAVPAGLVEAGSSLGLSRRETFFWIRLPLALRYGLNAYQNEVIMFTKGTAVVSVITVTDLTAVANGIFSETYDPVTPMVMAALLYWIVINAMRLGFTALERYLNRHLTAHEVSRRVSRSARLAREQGAGVQTDAATAGDVPAAAIAAPAMALAGGADCPEQASLPSRPASSRPDRRLAAAGLAPEIGSNSARRTASVTLEGIDKSYGAFQALKGVSLEVAKGEIIVICGPSGSGKSTLIRCINQLERHDAGKIVVNGITVDGSEESIRDVRLEVGFVFQQFNLFPHLTVLENCVLALRLVRNLPRPMAERFALRSLERVQLAGHVDKYPAQLSGGQQQRVAIARTLCMEPPIILFDEPTSALDPETIREVLRVMEDLASDGMTMVCVTHEMGFARRVADRCIFMDAGEVVESAPAEEFFAYPKSDRLKTFIGQVLH